MNELRARYAGMVLCAAALLLLGCSSTAPVATVTASRAQLDAASRCAPNPLDTRALYLRGGFNGWAPANAQRFTYFCNRFELVTRIEGEHSFKVGDEAWSTDADLGATNTEPTNDKWQLAIKAKELKYRFSGLHKLVLNMADSSTNPSLTVTNCPAPPLGNTTLYLRGTMNNWAALDTYAFQYSCDAYYLNVKLNGAQEFKIAPSAWAEAATFAANGASEISTDQALMLATGNSASNLLFNFNGEHTVRLSFPGGQPSVTIGKKTYADPRAASVSNPVALSLKHDSRALEDKSPFGAVAAGASVSFGLSSTNGVSNVTLVLEKRRLEGNQDILEYNEVARVPMTRSTQNDSDRFTASYTFKDISLWGYYFEVMIGDKTFIYQNNQKSVYWTREQGANGEGRVEEMPTSRSAIRRFRHTVYAKDFVVPAWAKDTVYYYIFPERFRNGEKRNDHKPGVDKYQDKPVEFHANWLDKPFKPSSGDGSDAVYNNDFYGGDIAGITEKLDYIKDLGANALYITPMFSAASNHKYDTADYKNIDPHFGTNADFTRLCDEARKRGIRVIVDASFNHVGSDSIYFDRFGKYETMGAFKSGKAQPNSPYADWFKFNTNATEPEKQYTGWVGVADLPEVNKVSQSFRDYTISAKDSVTKLWLDRGAAGWRMDVAPWVPDDYWREWRSTLRAHKPDAISIAETWFDSSKFFLGDMFDSTMNYIFRNTVLEYAAGGNARELYHNIEYMREVYPPQAFYALMNLLSTHDQARSLHILGYQDGSKDEAAIKLAKQRLRLAVFFQMMFPGAPAVYYGDEVGVTGGEDPYNRATYPWADLGGKPDEALLADFKRLIKLRNDNAVLREGSIEAPLYMDDNVIVLLRRLGNVWAITATNNATKVKEINLSLPLVLDSLSTSWRDALANETLHAKANSLKIRVPPNFGTVLINR